MTTTSKERIDELVKSNDVVLFMKGTPCSRNAAFRAGRSPSSIISACRSRPSTCSQTRKSAQGIKEYSDWPTIPQLYVKGEFVGGSDIMMEMFESGELKQLVGDA